MKRYYNKNEVWDWMSDNNRHFFYVNGDDKNIFVRKRYGIGWVLNLGNPWVLGIIGGILLLIFVRMLITLF